MTALTPRQRTAINAVLSLIHSNGHNASAISQQAKAQAAQGVPLKAAYDRAVEAFMATAPELSAPIAKVARLVMKSDDATVAQYGRALDSYIATGDESALNALAPTIARDSLELAIRSGELPPGSTGPDALAAAMGGEVGPAMVEALNAPAPAQIAPQAAQQPSAEVAPQGTRQSFQFATGAPAQRTAPAGAAIGHGGGIVSAKAAAKWARDFPGGIVPEGTRLAPHEQGHTG